MSDRTRIGSIRPAGAASTPSSAAAEALESRVLLAIASGAVFQDFNNDGVRAASEPGIGGRTVYQDMNNNGVLSHDIERGIDRRLSGPRRLVAGAPSVRIAIHPGTPAPPPERGLLDTRDPIRFGRAEMVSFNPLGGATPGTFYLAGDGVQAAVRVTGETSRIRLLIHRKGAWRER